VQFGTRVPVVRCWHHVTGSGTRSEPFVLSLTPMGQVYRSESFWEFDPGTIPAVLARMEQDLSAGPDQFRRRWRPKAMAWYFFSFAGRVSEETSSRMRTAAARLAALTRAGGSGDLWSAVGSLYYAGGESAKAISAYERRARVSGNHQATACLLLADLYRQEGQPDEADALLKRMPSLDSTDAYYIAIMVSGYQSASEPNRAADWQRIANMAAKSRRADAPFSSSYRLLILVFALWLLAVIVVAIGGAVYFAARRLPG
jgi:tetratricopeptide (TPR) repeat protein